MLTSRAATKTMKFAACADLTQLRGSSFHILAQYLDVMVIPAILAISRKMTFNDEPLHGP